MTEQGAERAVTVSALVVAGVYTYRRLSEGSGPPTQGSKVKQLAGQGAPASVGAFITAWGAAFLIISIITEAAPGLGGSLALLIATADFLTNTEQVASDIQGKVTKTTTADSIGGAASTTTTGVRPLSSSSMPPGALVPTAPSWFHPLPTRPAATTGHTR